MIGERWGNEGENVFEDAKVNIATGPRDDVL
jgi:hypothetical protein